MSVPRPIVIGEYPDTCYGVESPMRTLSYLTTFLLGMLTFGIFYNDIVFAYRNYLYDSVIYFGSVLIFCLFALLAFFWLFRSMLNRFARKHLRLEEFSGTEIARKVGNVLSVKDGMSSAERSKQIEEIVLGGITFLTSVNMHRQLFTTLIAIITAAGGTLGAILVMRQNEKIGEQTDVIRAQLALAEKDLIRAKSEERDKIGKELSAFVVKYAGHTEYLATTYGHKSNCFSRGGASILAETPQLHSELKELRLSVGDALKGLSGDAQYEQKFRSELFERLATSGLPFSLFARQDWGKISIENQTAHRINLDGAAPRERSKFANTDFSYGCIDYADLGLLEFDQSDFSNAKLFGVTFYRSNLEWSSFVGAELAGSEYKETERVAPHEIEPYPRPDETENKARKFVRPSAWQRLSSRVKCWWKSEECYVDLGGYGDYWGGGYYSDGWADVYKLRDTYEIRSELTDFSTSNLKGANFKNAKLISVSFEGADAPGSVFRAADLSNPTSFKNAVLAEADLRFSPSSAAALSGTDFTKTNLKHAVVDGQDFGNAAGLTDTQLKDACVCSDAFPKFHGKEIKLKRCDLDHHVKVTCADKVNMP